MSIKFLYYKEELIDIISEESDIIQCLALQLQKRRYQNDNGSKKKDCSKKNEFLIFLITVSFQKIFLFYLLVFYLYYLKISFLFSKILFLFSSIFLWSLLIFLFNVFIYLSFNLSLFS